MKKRILALLLTVAMMVAALPFAAIPASAAVADNGVYGTMHSVPTSTANKDDNGYYHIQGSVVWPGFTSNGATKIYKKSLNGEWLWIAPHSRHKDTGAAIDINGCQFSATSSISGLEFDDTAFVAIRMKVRNYSNKIDYSLAHFRLRFGTDKGTVVAGNNETYPVYWYDLEQNSVSKWFANDLDSNSTSGKFCVMGDIDGYMLVPVALVGADYVKNSPNMYISFDADQGGAADTTLKKFTWENKEMLIGEMLIVDKEKFVAAKIAENGSTKYKSSTGDTAIIAQRINPFEHTLTNGYNCYMPGAMSGKFYTRADASGATKGTQINYASLSNGDVAMDISTTVTGQTSVFAYPAMRSTYEENRTKWYDYYNTGNVGVPAALQQGGESFFNQNAGVALRVAVTGNEGKTINAKYTPMKNTSGDSLGSYLGAGKLGDSVIKFIDAKTGAISNYTLSSAGIPITGNIDGWFVVPDFSAHYWTAAGSNAWDGYFKKFTTYVGWRIDVTGLSDAVTQKYYMGDIFFVQDTQKFIDVHSVSPLVPDAASLSLADDLYVNYKLNIARYNELYNGTTPSATFTVGNGATESPIAPVRQGANLVFTLEGITPQQIGDNIATVISNGTVTGATHNYSVKTYVGNMIAKELEKEEAKRNTVLTTLLADLLNYGAEAQKYANYKTDAYVNEDLDQNLATADLKEVNSKTAHEALEGATHLWKAAGLRLNEKVEFRFSYKLAEGATCNGGYIKATDEKGVEIGRRSFDKGSYVARFMGLNADEMRKVVKFQLFDKENNPISGVLTYSIESYVAAKKGDATVGELVTAMMKYGDAAEAYGATL